MSDLLKEAIADARAVRETALANAKMALEEAFTPQLKSMLSAKLREDDEELEDEVPLEQDEFPGEEEEVPLEQDEVPGEEEFEDEVPLEQDEFPGEEEEEVIEINGVKYAPVIAEDDEALEDEVPLEQDEVPGEEEFEDEVPLEQDEIPGEDEEGVIEINGVKYAPVIAEDDEEFPSEESEDELDLESIIKELEDELDDEETVEEQDDAYDKNVEGKKDSEHIQKMKEQEE